METFWQSKRRQNVHKWSKQDAPKRKGIIQAEPVKPISARPPKLADLADDECHSLESMDDVDGALDIINIGMILVY